MIRTDNGHDFQVPLAREGPRHRPREYAISLPPLDGTFERSDRVDETEFHQLHRGDVDLERSDHGGSAPFEVLHKKLKGEKVGTLRRKSRPRNLPNQAIFVLFTKADLHAPSSKSSLPSLFQRSRWWPNAGIHRLCRSGNQLWAHNLRWGGRLRLHRDILQQHSPFGHVRRSRFSDRPLCVHGTGSTLTQLATCPPKRGEDHLIVPHLIAK